MPPLIEDVRAAGALGWRSWGWLAQAYGRYLELAAELGDSWCPGVGLHVVEYGLFKVDGR